MANYRRDHMSTSAIAVKRSHLLTHTADRILFMNTFDRVRKVAPSLAATPLDLETVCDLARQSSVMEAAMIEALASLRVTHPELHL